MIAVIDYDTGNLCSVANALERLGAEYKITSSRSEICSADRVLLPGVGEASGAMQKLRERDLVEVIRSLRQPVLGICVGLQLLCASSEENDADCIGIFDNVVKRFDSSVVKVPHMGWNSIENLRSPLFEGVDQGAFVYYVHSFAPTIGETTIASTGYGVTFSGALSRNNFYGTQFHPEKSAAVGERILKNFIGL